MKIVGRSRHVGTNARAEDPDNRETALANQSNDRYEQAENIYMYMKRAL